MFIHGLVRVPQFNGQWGTVESYVADMDRYVTRVSRGGREVVTKLRLESLAPTSGIPQLDTLLPANGIAAAPSCA